MFRKKKDPEPVPAPTTPVLIRVYDTKAAKDNKAFLLSAGGSDDRAMPAIVALAEHDANALAVNGYRPTAMSWAAGVRLALGPALTVVYVREATEAAAGITEVA